MVCQQEKELFHYGFSVQILESGTLDVVYLAMEVNPVDNLGTWSLIIRDRSMVRIP